MTTPTTDLILPATTPTVDPADISTRAVLVNVRIHLWECRRHDRRITAEVNTAHAAGPHAGRYHKHLFGGAVSELTAVLNAAGALRTTHYAHTLPWDTGWRLLPTANYLTYAEQLRGAVAAYDAAADEFAAAYDGLVDIARARLGNMFDPAEYPTAAEARQRYRAETEFTPLPLNSDFRVTLPAAELAQLRDNVNTRVTAAIHDAVRDLWTRLDAMVQRFLTRMQEGKYIRDSLLDDIRALTAAAERLNVTHDPALEHISATVAARLGTLDTATLRANPTARAAAAAAATNILTAMRAAYTPPTA